MKKYYMLTCLIFQLYISVAQTPVLIENDPSFLHGDSYNKFKTLFDNTYYGSPISDSYNYDFTQQLQKTGWDKPDTCYRFSYEYNTQAVYLGGNLDLYFEEGKIISKFVFNRPKSCSDREGFSAGFDVFVSVDGVNYDKINYKYTSFYEITIENPVPSKYYRISMWGYYYQYAKSDELFMYELLPLINTTSSTITDNNCVTLTATVSGGNYLWSTGETTQSIMVCNAGTYTCNVSSLNTNSWNISGSISITKAENQDNLLSPNGEVYSIYKNGNTVYYGGEFDAVGPTTGSGTIIDKTNAKPNTKFPRIVGTIYSTLSDGKGGWYIGGIFNKVGNYPISNIVHINSDFSIDTQFKPQPNDTVNTMYLNGSSLYIGGAFTTIKDIPFNYLVKLDKKTGDPDVWNAQCNGVVRSITLIKDVLVVGGDFSRLGGADRNYLGAVDTTYVQATAWAPNPNNKVFKVYNTVTKLYVGGDFTTISGINKSYGAGFSLPDFSTDVYNMRANGRIYDFVFNNNILYVAGEFTSIGGSNRNFLAALNPLNSNAYSFDASASNIVRTLTISDGNLIVGGDFWNIGGQGRSRIASLNLTSGLANDWNPSISDLRIFNPIVYTLSKNGNNIFVGGKFTSVGAIPRYNAVAMDAITGEILPWNPSPDGPVRVIVGDNTNLYLGGDFGYIGGQNRRSIAQLNPLTGLATGWNPNPNNNVYALALKDKTIYVGGEFTYIGGTSRSKIAALSTTTGSATPWNPNADGNVNALAISGDQLFVGGDFTTIGGQVRNRLAAYQLSSNALLGFNPNVNGSIKTIAANDNSIFVGGQFSVIGGAIRKNLAQIDLSGNLMNLNTQAKGQQVFALALQDTSLYVGGDYNFYNSGYPITNLAAVKTNTNLLGYWQPEPDDIVRAICVSTNKVYVGGRFKQINGRYQPYFASLDIFNSGNPPVINSVPNMIGCTGNGLKIKGTDFVNILDVMIDNTSVPFVVDSSTSLTIKPNTAITGKVKVINAIGSNISTEIVTIYESPVADLSLTGSNLACEGSSISLNTDKNILLTYKWLRNNVEIPNATNATFNATLSGDYILQVTNANGCITNSKVQSVLINAKPEVTVTADGPLTICEGTKLNLTANTVSENATYAWKKDGQYLSGTSDVLTKTYQVSSLESGNYTVEVSVNGCTTESTITSVQVNTLPSSVITNSGLSTFCQGASTTLTANTGAGFTFSWFKDNQALNGSTNSQNVNQTGNYTCKITNSNNCSQFSNGIFIKVNSLPNANITSNGNTTFCQGGNVTLTASSSNSYLWSTGATTSSISVANTGNYNVKVTDANGCQNTSAVTSVKVNTLPTTVITPNGITTFCQGQNVTLSSTTAKTYLWSTGETTQSILVSTTGNYFVKLTDANGCQNTSTVTNVIVNPLPVASITTSGKTSYCQGETISVSLISSDGSSYLWSNGATTSSISPSQVGSYTVQVTDANGCKTTSQPIVLKMNLLPAVIAKATKTTVCLGDNVSLSGEGATTYVWDNSVSNGVSFVPSATKTYTVTGTDINGCSKTATISVNVNNLPNVVASASKTTICSGDNITLIGSGASTYVWDNNVSNGVAFNPSTSKTYTVTGTDLNGCTKTATISVAVNNLPNVIANASKTALCSGDNVTLTGYGATTYVWDNNVSNGVTFVPSVTKNYTVTGTDANGCIKTATISVAVNSLPNVVASASKTVVCSGDNVSLTGSGASSYVWDNNVSNGVSFVPNATKTYTVTGTDVNGCSKSGTVSIAVNNLPNVIANASKTTICSGDNITLIGSGASTYVWDNNVSNGVAFNSSASKMYTVIGTDANGCKKTATVNIIVNTLPNVIVNASKSSVCLGDNLILTGSGASVFTWDNNVSNGVSFVPSSTKTYSVTGTDVNGCSKTATISVTVNSLPTVIANTSKSSVCLGENVTLTGAGATTYVWDNNVSNGVAFNPIASKTYTVTGTDANGCTKTATVNIAVNTLPTVIANASKTTVCSGDNVTLTGGGATTYVWDNNVSNGVAFNPSASKTYTVTGTDLNGCTKTATISVAVNNLPNVIANASKTALCSGDIVTLTGSGATTYVWDNNVSNGVAFNPSASKTYTVTGTDVNGCKKTASINVVVNSLPNVIANASKTTVCSSDNVTLTGGGAKTYVWDNNVSNGVAFNPSVSKTYTVTGTDLNGCTKTATISVAVNNLPNVIANASKSALCSGDNVTLTGTGAATYVWDNNVINGVSFVPNATKTYTVTGTDTNGCTKTATVNIAVNTLPTVIANASKLAVCIGDNLTLTGAGASTYVWDNNVSNGVSFVPNATKSYTVTGTDANGCTKTATVNVTVNTLPTVIANTSKTAVCSGDNVTLTGAGATTYVWDNNVSNGVAFNPSASKTYTVTGTDVNGCTKTATISVAVNNLPNVIANASKTALCSGDNVTLTGSGASTYVWDNNVSNGVSFLPNGTKTYNVTGTDENGCTKTATVNVTVNNLPNVIANTSKTALCSGDYVTLTGSGASTYVWDNNVSNGVSFIPSVTKTYTVTGNDENGCTKTATISITVNSLPNVVISANGNTTSCKDGGLEILTSNTGTSYLWSSGEITSNIFPTQSGVYSLKLKDVNGCEGLSNSIKVTINPLPVVTVTTNGPITYCTTKLTELVASNGASYLWNDGSKTKTIKPTQSGSYFVKVTDINGCNASSEPIYLTVNDCSAIEELGFNLVRVYPNPTSSQLSIEIPLEYINLSYKLIDVAGKELVNGKLTTLINSIDVQSYSSGAYFFEIENGYKMKIIKE